MEIAFYTLFHINLKFLDIISSELIQNTVNMLYCPYNEIYLACLFLEVGSF